MNEHKIATQKVAQRFSKLLDSWGLKDVIDITIHNKKTGSTVRLQYPSESTETGVESTNDPVMV